MKNKIFVLLLCTISSLWFCAQLPLPCTNYHQYNSAQLQQINGDLHRNCFEINDPSLTWDANQRSLIAEQTVVHPGFQAIASGNEGSFAILPGETFELEAAWFEPSDSYAVPLYEKVEWGVKMPTVVQEAIDNWISNDQNGTSLVPTINPFDPEDIDVSAEISWLENGIEHTQLIYGFFYIPYTRNITDTDKNLWNWDEEASDFRFRLRWTPIFQAVHSVTIALQVSSLSIAEELIPFEFKAVYADPRGSFIRTTQNKHYFMTDDEHVFFPVGQNIYNHCYDCGCDIGIQDNAVFPPTCEECYADQGESNICCGVNYSNRQSNYQGWHEDMRDDCLPLASYLRLHEVLDDLSEAGANAFRFLMYPAAMDFEFEKMNNYYDRQYQSWELDQMIEQCHSLGLRIELNLQDHVSITNKLFGNDRWDFYTDDTCGEDNEDGGDHGWAYKNGCDIDEPIEFFELNGSCPELNYKKRLRYLIARYGYSPNIFLLEFFSEINSVNQYNVMTCNPTTQTGLPSDYSTFMPARKLIGEWHAEMARYIKEDLHHTRHLLAGNYVSVGPMNDYADSESPCDSPNFDATFESEYIDVISFNNYSDRWDKFKWTCGDTNHQVDLWARITCDQYENAPNNGEGHSMTSKPVVFGETGFGWYFGCDDTGYQKELVALAFTGIATCGMSWDEPRNSTKWFLMGKVNQFLQEHLFNEFNLQDEEWIPTYTVSDDTRTEVVCLKSPSIGSHDFVGVVMNRTWNGYSMENHEDEIINDCDVLADNLPPADNLKDYVDVDFDNQEVGFYGVGQSSDFYNIEIYNPYTLDLVASYEDVPCINSGHYLPLFYPTLNEEMPFCFFVAKYAYHYEASAMESEDHEDRAVPQMSTILANEQLSVPKQEIQEKQYSAAHAKKVIGQTEDGNGLSFFPNPCKDKLVMTNLFGHSIQIRIFDTLGNELFQRVVSAGQNQVDISDLSDGVYYIKCDSYNELLKVIKIQ